VELDITEIQTIVLNAIHSFLLDANVEQSSGKQSEQIQTNALHAEQIFKRKRMQLYDLRS